MESFVAGITLNKIWKSYGSRVLFQDVTITFSPGERVALTGPNGAGKTTLLRIIMGLEEATSGTVTLPSRVGMLKQNIEAFSNEVVIDVVMMGNKRLWAAFKERDELYDVEMSDDVGMRLGDLEGIIAEENGYTAESDAEIVLKGMGINEEYFSQKMHAIPTDIQFRVLLCQALFGEPQALLLDEPTNHLDMESIGWLETFLHNYKGALVVISHDRHFLNAITTQTADIDYETIIMYPGNYDQMILAKTSSRDQEERDSKSKEKKIQQLREFVAKFGAGTRASQVQSRLREIDRLQPQDLKKSNIQRPYIRLPMSDKIPGKIVLKVDGISKSYDDLNVIKKFSCEIVREDKIGIIGPNGLGKTTLIKMLSGLLKPDSGNVEEGHQVKICYFPQNHQEIIDKKTTLSSFEWLKARNTGKYDQDVRSAMGKMLFSGDDAFKPVATLSGGETARLILADMMLREHNVVLLDEPNNHLDLEAVSALAWCLNEYPGCVVVVSHDRNLIENVATKIIAFEKSGPKIYDGNLQEYLQEHTKK